MKLTVAQLRQVIVEALGEEALEARARLVGIDIDKARMWEEEPRGELEVHIAAVQGAGDTRELAAALRAWKRAGEPREGKFMYFYEVRKDELSRLRGGPAVRGRTDAILRTRDSSGRATARRR